MTDETKNAATPAILPKRDPIALSKRLWAGVVMLFISLGGLLGYDASDPTLSQFLVDNFESVVAGVAGALAIVSKVLEITRHRDALQKIKELPDA